MCDDLARAPVVLVLGAADAGKTTFIAWLANVLQARGLRVGIVDADVGQSEIGPPATVGLGAVRGPIARPGDAQAISLEFVGATSPGKHPWRTADATGRLAARARAMFDRVLIDTSGFIAGGFAAAVKGRKIAATDPDVVVVIQAHGEAEHLVRPFASRPRPRVIRLPPVIGGRPRSPAARRRRRAESLARHFAAARSLTIRASDVALLSLRGDPVALETIAASTMVGLESARGEIIGIAVVEMVDPDRGTLTLRVTSRGGPAIARVRVGEATAG